MSTTAPDPTPASPQRATRAPKTVLQLRLDPKLHGALRRMAFNNNTTMTSILEELIRKATGVR